MSCCGELEEGEGLSPRKQTHFVGAQVRSYTDSFLLPLAKLFKYLWVAVGVGQQAIIVVVEVTVAEGVVAVGILMELIVEEEVEVALLFAAVVKMSLRQGPAEVGPGATQMHHFARRSTVPFQAEPPHGRVSREPVVPKT